MNLISVLPAIRRAGTLAVGALGILASGAFADSISPTSYSASLGIGEKVTIRKTVTITEAPPTSALIDVMFVFDTTGSMGTAIAGAKATATSLITSLGSFGSVGSGVGFYNDPGAGVLQTISLNAATTQATINTLSASGGGDTPELGYDGVSAAATGGAWRAGSNRFIIALGDAPFKNGADNQASTAAKLLAANADLVGIRFGSDTSFDTSITGLGGSVFTSGTSADAIAAAITAGITAGFAKYTTVTVDDLGGGAGIIDVDTKCVSADSGACFGADAVGTYDRSKERTFEFDVTFTRLAGGDLTFDTFAIVDKGIVARERDTFTTPEPATLVLMGVSLLGIGAARRRRSS
ncbi:MAG: PEP-CTERM sorting domain-containing protein [Candidatus Accumulibacter phosphatis]|uniref:PEP-CTERM sorting domain-containing protein n=1 Tax=Candidatus Accumulibacter phosphatis TaxID=327160 RepID=UPI001A556504|nr:PEP-CTERM sorting domain-containing protein [Candidatus Accumulibacter phosphatis]